MDPWDNFHLFLEDAVPPALNLHRPELKDLRVCERDPETRAYLLAVEHNPLRKLVGTQLAPRLMKRNPIDFCEKCIPKSGSQFATKRLPHLELFNGLVSDTFSSTTHACYAQAIKVSNSKDILKAMTPVLASTAGVMSMVWPEETKDHTFMRWDRHRRGDPPIPDELLCRVAAYQKRLEDKHRLETTHKLIIFCFAPWGLGNEDLSSFVAIKDDLPFRVSDASPPKYNKLQRAWAKIWDVCAQKRCPFFAVTNGDNWVFGWFLAGWTRATVSGVVRRNDKTPTVMQCLVYWLASAMELKGALRRPIDGFSARAGNPDINDQNKLEDEKTDWFDGLQMIPSASDSALVTMAHPDRPNVWATNLRNV